MAISFQEFLSITEELKKVTSREVYDDGGFRVTANRPDERIGRDRRLPSGVSKRMKAVGGGKLEPEKERGTRSDAGVARGANSPAPNRSKTTAASTASIEPGTAGTKGSAAMDKKALQRKAYLERRARERGEKQPETADKAISQAAPKSEAPKTTRTNRKWRGAEGERLTRQERDKARNAETTAANQKTKKSANEILAKMRKDFEENGGTWNSKVAVQMRAKAKAAAKASES